MEYWKLKGLRKLAIVYEEIKDDIGYFLKLHRLSRAAGMNIDSVVNLLGIANNDLQTLENRFKKLQQNVNHLESKELDLSITLEELKSQIRHANQRLGFYLLSCQKEVSKMFRLYKKNMRLNDLLTQFKNSDEEYAKIRQTAKQAVRAVLSDSRSLLKIALVSLIESLRADPTKFNFLIHDIPHPLTGSYQNRYAEALTDVIANETSTLYEKMVKDFANQTISDAANGTTKRLPSTIYFDQANRTQIRKHL